MLSKEEIMSMHELVKSERDDYKKKYEEMLQDLKNDEHPNLSLLDDKGKVFLLTHFHRSKLTKIINEK